MTAAAVCLRSHKNNIRTRNKISAGFHHKSFTLTSHVLSPSLMLTLYYCTPNSDKTFFDTQNALYIGVNSILTRWGILLHWVSEYIGLSGAPSVTVSKSRPLSWGENLEVVYPILILREILIHWGIFTLGFLGNLVSQYGKTKPCFGVHPILSHWGSIRYLKTLSCLITLGCLDTLGFPGHKVIKSVTVPKHTSLIHWPLN